MFAIIRTQKIKNWGGLRKLENHHFRLSPVPHADPNGQIIPLQPPADLVAAVRDKIGNQTIRKNAVLANEIFCSASPEYFRPDCPEAYGVYCAERLQSWVDLTEHYLSTTYGNRFVAMVLHLDEATPHIHAILVPLDDKRKLNSRELFNPQTLTEMQTSYAEAVKELGLQRGQVGSQAKHKKIRTWYAEQAALKKQKDSLRNAFDATLQEEANKKSL